jgi:hypothetical protein
MISGFHHKVDESQVLLSYYAASSGNLLPTFRDNLSVPSSEVKNPESETQAQHAMWQMPINKIPGC